MGMYLDLIGKQFGRLTVVGNTGKTKKPGGQIWECRCSCGNVVYKTTANLKNDNCKSCGCLRKEIMSRTGEERKKDRNTNKNIPNIGLSTREGANRNSRSGIRGVSWVAEKQMWKAQIMHKRKSYHLCYSKDLEYATKIRKIAEEHVKDGTFLQWIEKFKRGI